MITCQPDRISELSSEELHKLAVKACAEMRANGELDKAINEASEDFAKRRIGATNPSDRARMQYGKADEGGQRIGISAHLPGTYQSAH